MQRLPFMVFACGVQTEAKGLTDTACGGAELFSLMHMRSLFCVKTSNFPNSFRSPFTADIHIVLSVDIGAIIILDYAIFCCHNVSSRINNTDILPSCGHATEISIHPKRLMPSQL